MKNMSKKVVAFIFVFALISALIQACAPQDTYAAEKEELARAYGVQWKEYASFPDGYYYIVLKPGMPIEKVHSIVTGYKKVYNCSSGHSELYYYFSTSEEDAIRFELFYDDGKYYKEMRQEDADSRTLSTGGCTEGVLEPK